MVGGTRIVSRNRVGCLSQMGSCWLGRSVVGERLPSRLVQFVLRRRKTTVWLLLRWAVVAAVKRGALRIGWMRTSVALGRGHFASTWRAPQYHINRRAISNKMPTLWARSGKPVAISAIQTGIGAPHKPSGFMLIARLIQVRERTLCASRAPAKRKLLCPSLLPTILATLALSPVR